MSDNRFNISHICWNAEMLKAFWMLVFWMLLHLLLCWKDDVWLLCYFDGTRWCIKFSLFLLPTLVTNLSWLCDDVSLAQNKYCCKLLTGFHLLWRNGMSTIKMKEKNCPFQKGNFSFKPFLLDLPILSLFLWFFSLKLPWS